MTLLGAKTMTDDERAELWFRLMAEKADVLESLASTPVDAPYDYEMGTRLGAIDARLEGLREAKTIRDALAEERVKLT